MKICEEVLLNLLHLCYDFGIYALLLVFILKCLIFEVSYNFTSVLTSCPFKKLLFGHLYLSRHCILNW